MELITVQDYDNVVKLIDVCTQRGAFRGEELREIVTIREKFVNAVQKHIEAEKEKETKEKQTPPKVTVDDKEESTTIMNSSTNALS